MREQLISLLRKTPFYSPLWIWVVRRRRAAEVLEWERNGGPIPSHVIKERTLREYARKYGLTTLVETGTYMGEMVEAMRADFSRIYSIELSDELFKRASKRFRGAKNIVLINGDSGSEIERILEKLEQPALFWLDAHYSAGVTVHGAKDTPIIDELEHILNYRDLAHVVIIDDARLFGENPAYPSVEVLTNFVKSKRSNLRIAIKDDIIRIEPEQ